MSLPFSLTVDRRSRAEDTGALECLTTKHQYFDKRTQTNIVKIIAGEWYVSGTADEMIATILGSCVAACIRDPQAGMGGMNHFLLPGEEGMDSKVSDSARYGVFAMETLINSILKAGGNKNRLEIKVFGGGNVINNSARIGSKNAQFIRSFLHKEGFRITSEDLEGEHPRRVHYYPVTGKVMMRKLMRKEDKVVVEEEEKYKRSISNTAIEGSIDLF